MRVQRPWFAGAGLEAHVAIVHGLGARRNEVRIPIAVTRAPASKKTRLIPPGLTYADIGI